MGKELQGKGPIEKGVILASAVAVVGLIVYLVYALLCVLPVTGDFLPGC